MTEDIREVSSSYLNLFIKSIQLGYPVVYVESSQILAVDHPSEGYLGLQLKDRVVSDELGQSDG